MTSNLIAFWGLQEKERELGETLRHNLETEAQNRRKLAIDEALGKLNYQVSMFRANEEARHNAAQERISDMANVLRSREVQLTALRNDRDYELGLANVAQKEKERVQESYLTQKKMAQEERLKTSELGIRSESNTIEKGKIITDLGLNLTKLAIGYGLGKAGSGGKPITTIGKIVIGGLALNGITEIK